MIDGRGSTCCSPMSRSCGRCTDRGFRRGDRRRRAGGPAAVVTRSEKGACGSRPTGSTEVPLRLSRSSSTPPAPAIFSPPASCSACRRARHRDVAQNGRDRRRRSDLAFRRAAARLAEGIGEGERVAGVGRTSATSSAASRRISDVDLHLETGASRQRQQSIQRELVDLALQKVVEAGLGNTEAARGLRLRGVPGPNGIMDGDHHIGANFHGGRCSGLSDRASHTFARCLVFMISTLV